MRRLFGLLALCCALLFGTAPAFAADVAHGGQIFSANCVACHMGGGNVVNGERTLKAEALDAYLANYGDGHEAAYRLSGDQRQERHARVRRQALRW